MHEVTDAAVAAAKGVLQQYVDMGGYSKVCDFLSSECIDGVWHYYPPLGSQERADAIAAMQAADRTAEAESAAYWNPVIREAIAAALDAMTDDYVKGEK